MNKSNRNNRYCSIMKALENFNIEDIEQGVFHYAVNSQVDCHEKRSTADDVMDILRLGQLDTDISSVVEFFGALLEENIKSENGIVFTPKYIADYIIRTIFSDMTVWNDNITILDPGCGCGIFLVSAIEYINKRFNVPIQKLLEKNILGADVDESNVRRCHLIMKILAARNGEHIDEIPNIRHLDCLKVDWKEAFGVNEITYVVGNPPYINPHALDKQTTEFLKATFSTTTSGVFNIFYAFIEHSMCNLSEAGTLGFIVPNNFLTIKSALKLREYLQKNMFLQKIIDFGENMVFKPVRTYNCILFLSRNENETFEYAVMDKTPSIEKSLEDVPFYQLPLSSLDKHGWKLVNAQARENLRKIENQPVSIKKFIRTGIATLKDGAYMVERDPVGFYKTINGNKFYIEPDLVKVIYKVPDLKQGHSIFDAQRYIIFPYMHSDKGYTLIAENMIMQKYPRTYECLLSQKDELDARDKGKKNPQGWYAYGRTQGLNRFGKKLLFPTFSSKPRFLYVDDEDALFCNGYAVFENEEVELTFLSKILNSCIMDYYISNTSYAIEGGYYCYQKKYIEKFSLPLFTESEISYIKESSQKEIDSYLINRYGLSM